jgi:transposase
MVECVNALEEEKRNTEDDPVELEREVIRLREEAEDLRRQVAQLKEQVDFYTQRLFGRRSERFENPDQTDLFDEILPATDLSPPPEVKGEEEAPCDFEEVSYTRRRARPRGPKPLPPHLPRDRVEIDPPEAERVCSCCQNPMERVGEKITEELTVKPPEFRVRQLVQGEWQCGKGCMNRSVSAPLPPRPIENGRPSASLLAFIIASKYADHLPLYRQSQIFKRSEIELGRSTMNEWLGHIAELLRPLVEAMKRRLLMFRFLQSDDTRVQVLDRGVKGKSRRYYLWAYTHPGGEVVYELTESHAGKWPRAFLEGWEGHLQCDGHASYNDLFRAPGRILHIGCLAHIRRKLFEARVSAPGRVDAILALIRSLYAIEREADEAGIRGEALVELRRERALPLLGDLETKLNELASRTTPQSRLGRAVKYALGQWSDFCRYVEVAEARIDNNYCENAMRPIALNRKNSLFLGSSEGGGQRAEVFFSLVQSCRQLGIDPFAYLSDVIDRVSTHPQSRIDELTPLGWREARARAENAPSPTAL